LRLILREISRFSDASDRRPGLAADNAPICHDI
jgi:hypothetical protein